MTFFLSHTHTHTHTHTHEGQKGTLYQRSIQACLILFFVGFFKLIFIGLYLLPIHISPLFWIFFPLRSPTALSISVLYRKFSLAIYCIHSVNSWIHVNPNLPTHPSSLLPWYPYICSLCLCLYFCFANKIMPPFITFHSIAFSLQMESLRQPYVVSVSRHHFPNSICSLHVSVLHFGDACNVSHFFIMMIFVTVMCDQ